MAPDDRDRSYDYFLSEAQELLHTIEQGLLGLHQGNRLQNIHELMRATHTLKGAAANVGRDTMKKVAHTLEDAFKALYNDRIAIDPELEELLFGGYECLRLPLMAQMSGTEIDETEILDRAAVIFSGLQEKLGDDFGQQDYIPSSAELGFDIAQSIFEMGVQQRLDELRRVVKKKNPQQIVTQFKAQAEVFIGLAQSLSLPGWGEIAEAVLSAFTAAPDRALEIAPVALADLARGQQQVLEGDRTSGGKPSAALVQLSGAKVAPPEVAEAEDTTLARELKEFEEFLASDRYSNQPAKPEVRRFFLRVMPAIARWFEYDRQIPPEKFGLEVAVPKLELEELKNPQITSQTLRYIKNWVYRFSEFLTIDGDRPSLCLYRQWSLFSAALAVTKFHYASKIYNAAQYQNIPPIALLRKQMKRIGNAYKKHPPVTVSEKNWLDGPHLQKLNKLNAEAEDSVESLLEEIWGTSELEAEDTTETTLPEETESVTTIHPDRVAVLESDAKGHQPQSKDSPPAITIRSDARRDSPKTPDPPPRETTKRSGDRPRHFVSVDLRGIDRLNHGLGELLIGQNRQALDETKLKRATQSMSSQLKRHQETIEQLLNWSERVRGALDRKSIAHSSAFERFFARGSALGDFDFLEIEDYTEFQAILHAAATETAQLETIAETFDFLLKESGRVTQKQKHLLSVMQDDLVGVRMLPIGEILDRFSMMVEQLSRVQKKSVRLKLLGADLLVDREIANKLYDPLLHLIRNAFDHGIEPIDERRQQGKPETGTIEIRAYERGTYTIIEVCDDGRGLNIEWIRRRAVEGKFLTPKEANRLRIEDLLEVIFEPGFSTAQTVSEISGRGIGLDVVRSQLHNLNGEIAVQSKPQQGTTFAMQIPLTLTISKLMVVQAGGSIYALLLDAIEKILLPQSDRITVFENQRVLHLESGDRKLMVPVRQLADLMHYTSSVAEPVVDPHKTDLFLTRDVAAPVLLLRRDRQRMGLEVDQILGEQELVIRPLGAAIAPPNYVYGCSILSDGSLTLAIDGVAMLQQSLKPNKIDVPTPSDSPRDRPPISIAPALAAPSSLILVVDDSQNLRYSLRSTLEKQGYRILEAQDGLEALDRLQRHPEVELVLCDVEMPRMNGLEFLDRCRHDPELSDRPIVVLTSHTSEKYRQIATELGASAYLTKPYTESELLSTVSQMCQESLDAGTR
ncbi:MAG: response regulator [Cyanobacteriota bacterium]|nr:response regulator [Cyanobacteriota bacterium]